MDDKNVLAIIKQADKERRAIIEIAEAKRKARGNMITTKMQLALTIGELCQKISDLEAKLAESQKQSSQEVKLAEVKLAEDPEWWERSDPPYTREQLDTLCVHCGQRYGVHMAYDGGCVSSCYASTKFYPVGQ